MDQNPIAFSDFVGLSDEREGCETLENCGSCYPGLESRRDNVRFYCGRGAVFGIGGGSEPDDSVADFEVLEIAS